ncbi:putative serine esterase (DUF676) [Teratosphaeria destructans]|uniref:Serine esterase (DUF676) n=1 Tax=Teratosphaeria destructans TaxID=418781 RepID=A0A9W7SVY5_9PEZI|nr:putative serine esterase (DUF676) [Teratosphaeria destructans]
MKKTLLLVFLHGFKGGDNTFHRFPKDLTALLANALPKIDVLSVVYPQYETRGDLRECVAKFKDWLQNKVIDLEVANQTPSPTVDPSVHVVLCGHSMGGIVAAETLLSIAKDEPVPAGYANDTTNSTAGHEPQGDGTSNLPPPENEDRSSSAPPQEPTRLLFPYIQAVLAFDTPYLGISPGVLAHGAEEHYNEATTAYKAFNAAGDFFGWGKSKTPEPIANASSRGLPAADGSTGGSKWATLGKYAMYGGAVAAIAGAAGAAYLNREQITQGMTWAGSHLEFVGTLARGAELQKRVENVVALTKTHDVGFANFYGCLSERVSSKTQYAGSVLGQDRTFCVVPKDAGQPSSPTGAKRNAPAPDPTPLKKSRSREKAELEAEMDQGEQVHQFAEDQSKSKGRWVKCINDRVSNELEAHTSMFEPKRNTDYHSMVSRARDQIADWVEQSWYESSSETEAPTSPVEQDAQAAAEDGAPAS